MTLAIATFWPDKPVRPASRRCHFGGSTQDSQHDVGPRLVRDAGLLVNRPLIVLALQAAGSCPSTHCVLAPARCEALFHVNSECFSYLMSIPILVAPNI